ncbi:MAG: DUF3090 domain-containing protein [Actinomycetota bacterium]|nr:DUF3090 domain-containing protein [Actinomycetota bacterium]
MPVHDFDPPDRFVVGTVGPPGQRTFFLQASGGRRLVSVSCEKEQVSVLAERVNDLLEEFASPEPEPEAVAIEDTAPLSTPIEDEFRVATLSLAWDPDRSVVVIEAFDADLPESDAADEGEQTAAPTDPLLDPLALRASVRVVLDPGSARAFARRALALISAGRPPCPFCGGPLDPTGHVCPRANGYKR